MPYEAILQISFDLYVLVKENVKFEVLITVSLNTQSTGICCYVVGSVVPAFRRIVVPSSLEARSTKQPSVLLDPD